MKKTDYACTVMCIILSQVLWMFPWTLISYIAEDINDPYLCDNIPRSLPYDEFVNKCLHSTELSTCVLCNYNVSSRSTSDLSCVFRASWCNIGSVITLGDTKYSSRTRFIEFWNDYKLYLVLVPFIIGCIYLLYKLVTCQKIEHVIVIKSVV